MIVLWKRRIRLAADQVDRAAHWAPSNGARPDIGKAAQTNGGGVTRNAEGGEAMNTLRLNASVGCLIFGLMLSGAKAADCDGAITADEALKAEDARYAAQASSDFDAMGRLYGDDLVYVHSSAVIDSKASYIERQRSALHYRAMRRSNVKVRAYGCLAIITGVGDFDVTQNGQDSTSHILFHSIWAKRGPDLQFVSWEATAIPKQ